MPPIVIAHRGASGHLPEHTLAAYELGARQGADYIEPDLVSTRDGQLVARHENEISATTDVAERPELADRRTTKTIDGATFDGWFVEDFTLAELKTLRVRERIPGLRPGNAQHDGRYEIPTFQEVIDLAARLSVGIYPETKHPTYHDSIGLPVEPGLIDALRRNGLDHRGARVFVQSFEVDNLKALRGELAVGLVQLLGPRGSATPEEPGGDRGGTPTRSARTKLHIVPRDAAGASLPPTRFVGKRTGGPARPPVHVPPREQLPARRAALRVRTPPRPATSPRNCASTSRSGVDESSPTLPRSPLKRVRRCWD